MLNHCKLKNDKLIHSDRVVNIFETQLLKLVIKIC